MALFGELQSDDTGTSPFPRGLDVLIQALHAPSVQGAVEPLVRSWLFIHLALVRKAQVTKVQLHRKDCGSHCSFHSFCNLNGAL